MECNKLSFDVDVEGRDGMRARYGACQVRCSAIIHPTCASSQEDGVT